MEGSSFRVVSVGVFAVFSFPAGFGCCSWVRSHLCFSYNVGNGLLSDIVVQSVVAVLGE